jgi:hypothetical protein
MTMLYKLIQRDSIIELLVCWSGVPQSVIEISTEWILIVGVFDL